MKESIKFFETHVGSEKGFDEKKQYKNLIDAAFFPIKHGIAFIGD